MQNTFNRDPLADGRQSVVRQRRTTMVREEDVKFQEFDEESNEAQGFVSGQPIKFDDMKEDHFSSILETREPQDLQNMPALGQKQQEPNAFGLSSNQSSYAMSRSNTLQVGSGIPQAYKPEKSSSKWNPFASNPNRMTVQDQPRLGSINMNNPNSDLRKSLVGGGNDPGFFQKLDEQLKNDPTPLHLSDDPPVVVVEDGDEKSNDSGTPTFKAGGGGDASAKQRLNAAVTPKPDDIPKRNSHLSMQISNDPKLKVDIHKNRETVDIANLMGRIDEEPEIPLNEPVEEDDPTKDQLLPEEDPDNYLTQINQKEPEQLNGPILKQISSDVIQNDQQNEDGYNSDESFSKEFYLAMHSDMNKPKKESSKVKEKQDGLVLEESGFRNMVKIIDWNERRHRHEAKKKLNQHSELSTALKLWDEAQQQIDEGSQKTTVEGLKNLRIFTGLATLNSITNKLTKERQFSQARATALAISDDLLFIGTSEGQVWMFDRENEEDYDNFTDKSKEFLGNAVTAIDIHQLRSEYVVLGYERGQLVLYDATEPKKSVKTIKDHHPNNASIIDVKFCDWSGNKHSDKQDEFATGGDEDKKAWMFISMDNQGKVVINTVQKKLFVMSSSKHVIIDHQKNIGPMAPSFFTAVASRFHSTMHGQGIYDDMSIFAMGCKDRVYIAEARSSSHTLFQTLMAPAPLPKNNNVALSWGHGMSPQNKERPHSLLAIAWGPLIQIVVMIDHEDRDKPFLQDGFFVLRQIKPVQIPVQPSADLLKQQLILKATAQGKIEQQPAPQEENKQLNEESDLDLLQEAINYPELNIEVIQFISDSTLVLVTSTSEIRVVHTHSFTPQTYHPDTFYSQSSSAELESGIGRIPTLLKSDYSKTFSQSVKSFSGRMAVLTQKNVQTCIHLTWQQSIYEFKKQVHDDLIQVFSRAISIYKGRVKGYRGLLDNAFLRENLLKAELKLLVKDIIQQVVEKTKQETDRIISETINQAKPLMDQEGEESKEEIRLTLQKLDQYEDEKKKKFETLIRIAIEFCVELRDCDFLFKDLFWLFQEEKIEKLFVQELEPFIMAGRLKEWELPNEVIQNHVIKYYKDPSRAEALEKIIVNLNLKKCPKTIVLEFIHFSEMHFLTTAVLFLYTKVYEKKDNTSCTTVLCSLFDLYKKSTKKLRQEQIQAPVGKQQTMTQGQVNTLLQQHIDITMLKDASYDSMDKLQIERSQTYLGYKILWILNLFIDGKKFPSGSIRENKWRSYIHDIIEFLTNQEYLKTLLNIDAESVFQMISVIFLPTGARGPFELVNLGREEEENMKNQTPEDSPHWRFIKVLDAYCIQPNIPENVRLQYLFFVAKVIARSPAFEGFDPNYFYLITQNLLRNHQRYLDFVKKIYEMSAQAKLIKKGLDPEESRYQLSSKERQRDVNRCMKKVENDFINLIRKCEQNTLQMHEFFTLIENTNYNRVKTEILEKKQEYIKSLQMLLASQQQQGQLNTNNGLYILQWIQSKMQLLEDKYAKTNDGKDKNNIETFKREVSQNFKILIQINVAQAIKIVNSNFGGNHKDIIDQLAREPLDQLMYLDCLLDQEGNNIQNTIRGYIQESTNPVEAKKCIDILKLHLRLYCINRPQGVLQLVEKRVISKNSFYPIEDCLQICQEFKQKEAMFLLSKKLGKYFESVKEGLLILRERVDYKKILVELYYCQQNSISTKFQLPRSKKVEAAEKAEKEEKLKREAQQAAEAAIAYQQKFMAPVLSKRGRKVLEMINEQKKPEVKPPVEKKIPKQMQFFDQIFGKLLKICLNHSKEVEQKHEDAIWFIVVDTLIELVRPLALKKTYAVTFFEDRFYAFIEALVKVHRDGFRKLFDHLLRSNKTSQVGKNQNLHFSDLKEVILKMFGDQNLENLVLENANNSIRKVNSEIFQQFSQQTRFGILCRQRVCGVCKRYVDSFLYDDINDFQNFDSVDDDHFEYMEDLLESAQGGSGVPSIKVFACRHTFHIPCLKRYYLKKYINSFAGGKSEIDNMFKNAQEKLRCVTCNLKNIEVEEKSTNKRAAGVSTGKPQQVMTKTDSKNPEPEIVEEDENARYQQSKDLRSMTMMNKHITKLNRIMDNFDRQQGNESGLTLKDFKKM